MPLKERRTLSFPFSHSSYVPHTRFVLERVRASVQRRRPLSSSAADVHCGMVWPVPVAGPARERFHHAPPTDAGDEACLRKTRRSNDGTLSVPIRCLDHPFPPPSIFGTGSWVFEGVRDGSPGYVRGPVVTRSHPNPTLLLYRWAERVAFVSHL